MDERVTDLEKLAESLAPLPVQMEAVEGRLGVETRLGMSSRASALSSRRLCNFAPKCALSFLTFGVRWRLALVPSGPRWPMALLRVASSSITGYLFCERSYAPKLPPREWS